MTDIEITTAVEPTVEAACPNCLKPMTLCVCDGIEVFANRTELVILQHPQEQDRDLGTARLATLCLAKSKLRIGLSWPNLTKAVGHPADPKKWAVLYLGPAKLSPEALQQRVLVLDRQSQPLTPDRAAAALDEIEGVILLDGSWAQAKTLWWRNAWLLKCWRVALNPPWPSRYGRLRKEPRRDSVSTIEAAALILGRLEGNPQVEMLLIRRFEALLARYRSVRESSRRGSPAIKPGT